MNQAVAKYLKLSQEKINQNNWQEAKAILQKAIEIQPDCWDIYFNLGEIFLKQKQYVEAAKYFQYVIRLKPDDDRSFNNLGTALLKLGKTDNAIRAFTAAVSINQYDPQFFYNLGEALIHQSLIAQALVCFRQAVKLNPKDYQLQFQLGKSFRNQGLNQEAITCFCRAIQLNPSYTPAYVSLRYIDLESELNHSSQDTLKDSLCVALRDRLISFYRQILVKHPNLPDALANLAEALTYRGDLTEAIAISRQAIYFKTINHKPHLASANWQAKKEHAPDFIIIGAGKCGTTSLYNYLGCHPQILLPNKKEPRFFDKNFAHGYEWYLAQFPAISDRHDLLTGEASPSYLFLPQVAQRIRNFAPNIKLIVMLRNPVERSISDYYQNKKSGRNQKSLEDVIKEEIQRYEQKTDTELSYRGGSLLRSLYYYKLQRWMKIFPKNQFLIIKSENFFAKTAQSMKNIFEFLDLPNIPNDNYQRYNTGSYPQVRDDLREQLSHFFAPHNQRLEEYLEMDLNW